MISFDANRESSDFPQKLRSVRHELKMTQPDFAKAAGYTLSTQSRYEAKRGTHNCGTPSEMTFVAIKKMVESARAANSAGSLQAGEGALPLEAKSLKSVTPHQMEQAFALALRTLTGSHFRVEIKDVCWEVGAGTQTTMSLVVGTESDAAMAQLAKLPKTI